MQGSFFAEDLQSEIIRMHVQSGEGKVELRAKKLITGVMPVKCKYDMTFCISRSGDIYLYPLEQDIRHPH